MRLESCCCAVAIMTGITEQIALSGGRYCLGAVRDREEHYGETLPHCIASAFRQWNQNVALPTSHEGHRETRAEETTPCA